MAKKTAALLPATDELLLQFGDRLRLARLRRRLSAKQVAERAGMAPMTLRSLERGGAGVTMGAYLAVMQVLGIETDLDLLGKADPMGRELQDAHLPARNKAAARPSLPSEPVRQARAARPSDPVSEPIHRPDEARPEIKKLRKPLKVERDWIQHSGFTSADTLAALIKRVPPKKKAR